jgi:hypothetical protein
MSNSNKKNGAILNNKKILCFNMLNNKECNYGRKCVYAHSLSDQKIDSLRHKAYTIIKSAENLSNINLLSDKKLYDTLLQLTKMCSLCNKSLCPGGYNCRNGAINMKSKVCYEDFIFGNCKRNKCLATHLTVRGFVPYNKQKSNYKYKENMARIEQNLKEKTINNEINNNYRKDYKSNDLNHYNYTTRINIDKYKYNGKLGDDLNSIEGILLTEKFLLARYNKQFDDNDDSSYSEDEEQTRLTIEYLNKEDDDSTDESIFLV